MNADRITGYRNRGRLDKTSQTDSKSTIKSDKDIALTN